MNKVVFRGMFELVPVPDKNKEEILLYDIYVIRDNQKIWIGSKRTLDQCQIEMERYKNV